MDCKEAIKLILQEGLQEHTFFVNENVYNEIVHNNSRYTKIDVEFMTICRG